MTTMHVCGLRLPGCKAVNANKHVFALVDCPFVPPLSRQTDMIINVAHHGVLRFTTKYPPLRRNGGYSFMVEQ